VRQRIFAILGLGLLLATPAAGADGPALWSIEGRSNSVYLFGSIHLLRPGEFEIQGKLAEAYEDAEAIYMEVDLDDLSPLEMAAGVSGWAIDPEGRTLDELMGPKADEAHALAADAGIDLALLAHFEPWFAGLTVVSLTLAQDGYTGAAGVDQRVQALAARDGKQISGLETLDEQFAALDSMDEQSQREFLLKSLTDVRRARESVATLLTAWRDGDDAALADELATEFEREPALYQSLIVDRNRNWADQIEQLLDDDDDYLIIVGALHLVGADGLPAMLRARGIRVERH
jgi:uncharacterized protein YbaP (TraB family)